MAYLKKYLPLLAGLALLWLGVKFVLPVAMPFLLGAGLAVVSEPLVRRVSIRLPRSVSAGFGVTVMLIFVAVIVYFVGAVAVGQLKKLAVAVPDLQNTANQATQLVQDYLITLSERTPEGVRPMLQQMTLDFFDDGSGILNRLAENVPNMIGTTLSHVGDGAIGVGTGVLSAFLISARLPTLKEKIQTSQWFAKAYPAWQSVKRGLGGWIKAQFKLFAVTFGILLVGFWALRIPHTLLWAGLVALVDAVPILGTGTVLLPWSLVCFLQKNTLQGVGLLCIYGCAFLARTVLEPRLVGRQLGLDPLLTLGGLYLGYRFWGILGMLFAPILLSAVVSLLGKEKPA